MTQEEIEDLGWVFKQTNRIRYWYEMEDTFFECPMSTGHQLMHIYMIYDPDPEYQAITITAKYRGGEIERVYQGFCRSKEELQLIMNLINLRDGEDNQNKK